MTLSQKISLSLLISVVLFAGFTVLAYTGLFDLVEAKFYNPSIVSSLNRQIDQDAGFVDQFLKAQESRFSSTLEEAFVRRSFLSEQSAEDIFERSRIYGILLENTSGLQWVRFIDSGGARLHYSSRPQDILRQDETSTAYRNFNDVETGIGYGEIAAADRGGPRIIFDEALNRFLFSFPFYDSFDVFRGTALFSVSTRSLEEALIREGRIKITENITVVASPSGLVLGIPANAENDLYQRISAIWSEGNLNFSFLDSPESGASLVLVSGQTPGGIFLGRMAGEGLFEFPPVMKIVLLLSFFFTVYLTVFLILNLRQDSFTVVQNRLKRLQVSLIEQYYERKSDMDWGQWNRELEQRRDEIRGELKQGLKLSSLKKGKDGKTDIDVLIDKSWDELLGVIGSRRETGISEEKLKAILNKIITAPAAAEALQSRLRENKETPGPLATETPAAEEIEEVEAVEELVESAEEVESVEDLAESVEEVESVEELAESAEEVEAVEELAEDVEEIAAFDEHHPVSAAAEEVEAVEDLAESVEEVETVEELTESAEEVEAIEELAESAEEAEAVEELAESPEEIEAVEELAEDVEETEEVEAVEELAESVEEAANVEEIVTFEESAEEVETLEELEELEELSEVENVVAEEAAHQNTSDISESEFANLASRIEFSSSPEAEDDDEIAGNLEVVSPFASMSFDFSGAADEEDPSADADDEDSVKKNSRQNEPGKGLGPNTAELVAMGVNSGLPVIYTSFLAGFGIETLKAISGADPDATLIEEREGVPYINQDILDTGAETDNELNQDFKKLVNSVITIE